MGGAVALVAGSGIDLTPLLDKVDRRCPFDQFAGLGASTVSGHAGAFLIGRRGGRRVIVQQGRRHAYEGLSFAQVTRTVDLLHDLGAGTVVFTNAAGGVRPGLALGSLVAARSVRAWPYRHFSVPERQQPALVVPGCDAEGVYLWVHGPCYETPAEVRALCALGIDTVGMSTAPEMVRCRGLGIAAGLISCVTNVCLTPQELTHEHVLEMANRASDRLCELLDRWISGENAATSSRMPGDLPRSR